MCWAERRSFPVQGTIVEVDDEVEKRLQVVDDFSSSDSNEESASDDEHDESDHDDDDDEEEDSATAEALDLQSIPANQPTKINLDVSTLICLVSELTHGGHVYRYPNKWLEVPAEMERASRLAPKLENYMKGW